MALWKVAFKDRTRLHPDGLNTGLNNPISIRRTLMAPQASCTAHRVGSGGVAHRWLLPTGVPGRTYGVLKILHKRFTDSPLVQDIISATTIPHKVFPRVRQAGVPYSLILRT